MRKGFMKTIKVTALTTAIAIAPFSSAFAAEEVTFGVKVLEDTIGIVVTAGETNISVANALDTYNGSTSITIENAGTGSLDLSSRVDVESGSFQTGDLILASDVPSASQEIEIVVDAKRLSGVDTPIKTLDFNWELEQGETSTSSIDFKLGNGTATGSYEIPVVFTATR